MELIRLGDRLVPESRILSVDLRRLEHEGVIEVHLLDAPSVCLSQPESFDFVMRHAPYFIEGRRFRFARSMWAVHNLVAHPCMQILAWMGKRRSASASTTQPFHGCAT